MGFKESAAGIANKISRGSFSFAYYLMCMQAVGCEEFRISLTGDNDGSRY
jgi:hypothetical protein